MNEIPNIGQNLKHMRKKRHLSLDKLSETTGDSKAMLGQIERGESSPTLNTLWKLATGLKVSVSSLISVRAPESSQLMKFSAIDVLVEENGLMKIYPQFTFDNIRGFEMFILELEPGCNHKSEPHDHGVEEYVIVSEGEICIFVDEKEYNLKKGDALRYFADQEHSYCNFSDKIARFHHVIYYFLKY